VWSLESTLSCCDETSNSFLANSFCPLLPCVWQVSTFPHFARLPTTSRRYSRPEVCATDQDARVCGRLSASVLQPKRNLDRAWPSHPRPKWHGDAAESHNGLRPKPTCRQRRHTSSQASKNIQGLERQGLPPPAVLEALGPPRRLRAAYRAELPAAVPRQGQQRWPDQAQVGKRFAVDRCRPDLLDKPVGPGKPGRIRPCAPRTRWPGPPGIPLKVSLIQFS
jgi:hypothetical protein